MTAPNLLEVHVADGPAPWSDAGFTVVGHRVPMGPLTLVCTGDAALGAPRLAFDVGPPSAGASLDGIAWTTAAELAPPEAPVHPNGIDGFDHLVVMASSLDRVREALTTGGFEIRRERAARLGDAEITQVFAWAGPVLLEIVAPTVPVDPDGGSRIWGLALTSADLDATTAWFGERISAPKAAVQAGRRIATVRHRDLGLGLQVAVMTAR